MILSTAERSAACRAAGSADLVPRAVLVQVAQCCLTAELWLAQGSENRLQHRQMQAAKHCVLTGLHCSACEVCELRAALALHCLADWRQLEQLARSMWRPAETLANADLLQQCIGLAHQLTHAACMLQLRCLLH